MTIFVLNQTITYWEKGQNDGTGGYNWSAPVSVPARYAEKIDRFIDSNGVQYHTTHRVYTKADIPDGSYIYLGESSADAPITAAKEVRSSVNLQAVSDMRKYVI